MSFFNALIPGAAKAATLPEEGQLKSRRPHFQVKETDQGYHLTIHLPGVHKDGLEITDEGGELTVVGNRSVKVPEGAAVLHRETSDAPFRLVLSHDNTIDTGKIEAELRDGVLRLTLAKAESAKPRKIQVS